MKIAIIFNVYFIWIEDIKWGSDTLKQKLVYNIYAVKIFMKCK